MQTKTLNSPSVVAQTFAFTTHLPQLQSGMAGEAVRFLQQFLIARGYNLVFDGQFGPQTEEAVSYFQHHYNHFGQSNPDSLLVDGIVGKQTWRAISNNL
ncbi:MAG: peptidoglycan-binding protein [Symploca sp. SIO1B1]|nr:peptidoglycan-binding protein [Symploca sp. SIO1C2]NER96547.1 peptidoglycan-binding protein [Symploca sp. SIO1B1]